MDAYRDIRMRSRPVPCRPRMPRQNRAKIFAPYDALKGFEETVHAKEELFVARPELTDYAQERLDRRLRSLARDSRVTVTWFRPKEDGLSSGLGRYVTASGTVRKIDLASRILLLDRQPIWIPAILDIRKC